MTLDTLDIATTIQKDPTSLEKWLAVYHREPSLHQRLLQIMALLFYIPEKKQFVAIAATFGFLRVDNQPLTKETIHQRLNALRDKGLLSSDFDINPHLLHPLSAKALSPNNPFREKHLALLRHHFGYNNQYVVNEDNWLSNVRVIHLAVHLNDPTLFLSPDLHDLKQGQSFMDDLVNAYFCYPVPSREWLLSRHPVIQLYLLSVKLYGYYAYATVNPPDLSAWLDFTTQHDLIHMAIDNHAQNNTLLMSRLLQITLLLKPPALLKDILALLPHEAYYYAEWQAVLSLLQDDTVSASRHYQNAAQRFSPSHLWAPANIHGLLGFIAGLSHVENNAKGHLTAIIKSMRQSGVGESIALLLEALLQVKQNNLPLAKTFYQRAYDEAKKNAFISPLLNAFFDWGAVLLEPDKLSRAFNHHQMLFHRYRDSKEYLVAQLYAEILLQEAPHHEEARYFLDTLAPLGTFRFFAILPIKAPWEHTLQQLQHLVVVQKSPTASHVSTSRRLAWLIDPITLDVGVLEQSLCKNGRWGRGRTMSPYRLGHPDATLDYLSSHDFAVIKAGLQRETYGRGWSHQETFYWDRRETVMALIGHPCVFHQHPRDVPLELVLGHVELQVEKTEKGYHFSLSQRRHEPGLILEKETPNRYRVIDFTQEHFSISNILPQQGITVPPEAKAHVVNMICHAKSGIHIRSEITDDNLPTVAGDLTLHMHLLPVGKGIKATLWMKPFGETEPCYLPGEGQRSLITTTQTADGEIKQKIVRDVEQEKEGMRALLQQCPILVENHDKSLEWSFDAIEPSLELLLQLDDYKNNHPLVLAWPQGKPFKVKHTVSSRHLSLSIKSQDYWFEYDGRVTIDETHSLEMKQLLDLLEGSQGRFVPLANGEFLALTHQFKKQLEELKTISHHHKIYHLNTQALRNLAQEAGHVEEDNAWKNHLKKIKKMKHYHPTLPDTLQATLRDYQQQGFSYLARLAHWQIGACLADDMGLGKTVQAIALLLAHAEQGPALVIAPTSVGLIWLEELQKFAPTLKPYTLHNTHEREALIKRLNKKDVLLCSYDALSPNRDILTNKAWHMVILDEAQAIKNPYTKRWHAVTQLKAKCRVALTGTPIENHLGELWSIFHFLNPGLLGNQTFFQQRFSGPIERDDNPVAKTALKNIVSPYLLRRTKSEVLQELPSKIEQSILIEPTQEEMAFYEAVRMKALARIHALDGADHAQPFSVLQEISRLRQACCHAQLVDENIQVESSKIKKLLHLIEDLLSNNHKALIFSQFVRYLDIVKKHITARQWTYQYLDGSTTVKQRKHAVDAFQAGQSDLFLISLKAGGTGLNLTAADYVIILDPWWNPAVEDQAADRAHRMGQHRPVTIYRLIMQHSIEEKITALHQTKKDLADDLLSGSHMTGALSTEELIGLIAN